MLRTKRIKSGSWQTVEWFFNAGGTAFFKAPAGASIKVRYGVGFFGKDRQKQTLNGSDYKTLEVGNLFSLSRARMQVRVSQTTDVTYDIYADGDTIPGTPEIPFQIKVKLDASVSWSRVFIVEYENIAHGKPSLIQRSALTTPEDYAPRFD